MANITLGGNPIKTNGQLPAVGTQAPEFELSGTDLQTVKLSDFLGQRLVLNIFPSIDTSVCAASVRRFNQDAAALPNSQVLNISRDLPFAHKRFCVAEGIDGVFSLSEYINHNFGEAYGVVMSSGKLKGLHSRAVLVIDEKGKVVYAEQVAEIAQEPNYEAALLALK
jgi:thioredoxin-dependent peroxiredoxin